MIEAPRAPRSPLAADDPRLLVALRAEAAAVLFRDLRPGLGLEPGDLVSAGWLAYVTSDATLHAGCLARARGAMLDEVRRWYGAPWDHRTGARLPGWQLVQGDAALAAADERAARAREQAAGDRHRTRTRLPRRVRRALAQLPVRERRALWLWTVRDWPHEEIAVALGTSVGTSGRLRHQALGRLRAALDVAA